MILLNHDQVKDIQNTWKEADDKDSAIFDLCEKYNCNEGVILRVLEGDKNVTSDSYIKRVKYDNKDVASLSKQAVEEFKKEEEKKEEIPPKKKGGWPKGKPRGKKTEVTEDKKVSTELSEEDTDIILRSLESEERSLNESISKYNELLEHLKAEREKIHSIISKLKK